MKKNIWLSIICITFTGTVAQAQTGKLAPPPPPPPAIDMLAPPPPPPPLPPSAPEAPENTGIPVPPEIPVAGCGEPVGPTIVNNNGYDIEVRNIKGIDYVMLTKDNKNHRIKLSKWNSDKKYYEKKFGQLPPPPPPPPAFPEQQ